MERMLFVFAAVCLVACSSFGAEEGDSARADEGEKTIAEGLSKNAGEELELEEEEQVPVVEVTAGTEEGKVTSKGLPLNMGIHYDEKTFDKGATIQVYLFEKDIGLDAYERVGPVWLVKSDAGFRKKARYTFQFETRSYAPDARIVVLTWWRDNWIIAGIPAVGFDDNTVAVEADYGGYFVPVRVRSRDEISLRKYTFPDEEKRRLNVIGLFACETKCREGKNLLEEGVDFREHFSGEIVFGRVTGTDRTGVRFLCAESTADPAMLSFKGKVTVGAETVFATGYKIPEQRGFISAEQKGKMLRFQGLPTIITLTGLHKGKETGLVTMRGKLDFSGICFDWKLQEMFHLKNFIYVTQLTMPHGTLDERTTLTIYLQFIVT